MVSRHFRNPIRSPWLTLALAAGFAAAGSAAFALPDPHPFGASGALWGVNGGVSSMVQIGTTLYVAGGFTSAGPATGGGVPVDLAGVPAAHYPHVAGQVDAAVTDGNGGWYIGGEFTAVGGIAHHNLAHVTAAGEVDAWTPDPDGAVTTLVREGSQLYVGGWFRTIAGQSRGFLALIDLPTGALDPWQPRLSGGLLDMAITPDAIYLGGEFGTVNGQYRPFLAAVSRSDGHLLDWAPSPDDAVWSIAVTRTTVYAAGGFIHMSGVDRMNVAAIDRRDGHVTAWDPSPSGPTSMYDGIPLVTQIADVGEGRILLGGKFTALAGHPHNALAIVDGSSAELAPWDPQLTVTAGWSRIDAVLLEGSTVYLGGYFEAVGGVPRHYAAAVDLHTGRATSWDPRPDHLTHAIAAGPGGLYVGGTFSSVHDWVPRTGLAAFDVRSGQLTDWAPAIVGYDVSTIVSDGHVAYVGGDFWNVGGKPHAGVAALDLTTGQPTDWDPGLDGAVRTIVVEPDRVYVGGWFTTAGGLTRQHAAAVDRLTGAPLAWDPEPNDGVLALLPARDRMLVGGAFFRIGGQPRFCLAAVDTSTGAATAWDPEPDNAVLTMCLSGDSLIVGGLFSHIGADARPALAAIDTTSGKARSWHPQVESTPYPYPEVDALAVADGMIYAGGGFTGISGRETPYLVAFDGTSSVPTDWTANLDGGVVSILPTGGQLLLGGSFQRVGDSPSSRVGSVRPPGPPAVLAWSPARRDGAPYVRAIYPSPARSEAVVRYELPRATAVRASLFDVQGRRVAVLQEWQTQPAGIHELTFATARIPTGIYLCRLESGAGSSFGKVVVSH